MLNPPYDARNVRDVTMETLKIFKSFLDITFKYEAWKLAMSCLVIQVFSFLA